MLNRTHLARIDLNLLVLFEAVLEARHVARAAQTLHVTPSAVSHGLKRLRALLNDPLFLRHPKGVVPTERAISLAVPIAEILERARAVLGEASRFDPATSKRRFVIGAPDGASAVLLPELLAQVRRRAPGIDLGVRNLIGQFERAFTDLDERALDVALLPLSDIPGRFATRVLHHEDFVVVRRARGPHDKPMTLARYCAAPHLVVSVSGDPSGPIDQELAKRKLSRRVVLTVSNFHQALALVAESDLVAALPRQFVAKCAKHYRVTAAEPPFAFLSAPIRAVMPRAATSDAGLMWLVELLESRAKSL